MDLHLLSLEVNNKELAHLVESAVLHCLHHLRQGNRELIALDAAVILDVALRAAAALGIKVILRTTPTYTPFIRNRPEVADDKQVGTSDRNDCALFGPAEKIKLATIVQDCVTKCPRSAAGRPRIQPSQVDYTDILDDILLEPNESSKLSILHPFHRAPTKTFANLVRQLLQQVRQGQQEQVRQVQVVHQKPRVHNKVRCLVQTNNDQPRDVHANEGISVGEPVGTRPAELLFADMEPETFTRLHLDDMKRTQTEDRAYQRTAAASCEAELERLGRTVLQMACRCGKTRVAHLVLQKYMDSGQKVLYLVPGLALLRQTVAKLWQYGVAARDIMMVGSDQVALVLPGDGVVLEMTVDSGRISRRLNQKGSALIVSTYQSSHLLQDVFALTIFDECHRMCGSWDPRPFNHIILKHNQGSRLFMTATPRNDTPLSMRDHRLFGGVAYRYYLREGIQAGHVNDFEVQLVAAPPAASSQEERPIQILAAQIHAAMGHLRRRMAAPKMLVFTRSIRQTMELMRVVQGPADSDTQYLAAHSSMPRQDIVATLAKFCEFGNAAILFNCRLFQEGVEIAHLNAVFFASPRHSPRDIIQTICRPLNREAGKLASTIFVPIAGSEPAGEKDRLDRFASIIPFADALASEDPRFYEHLLNPCGAPYPLGWLGAHGSAKKLLSAARCAIRYGVRGRTDRLVRAECLPWNVVFGELRRTVEVCCRYPKNNDGFTFGGACVRFDNWYKWVIRCYIEYRANRPSPLEPHQISDLESLRDWRTRGIEGPYPWDECMRFLEGWLLQNGGKLMPVEIHRGGWIGLDATPVERLSGVLTTVSQCDGRSYGRNGKLRPCKGFLVAAEKAEDLDRIFGRFGLCWRKDRYNGFLIENKRGYYEGRRTCIQKAYEAFKAMYAADRNDPYIQKHLPGYPRKHIYQEVPDIWSAGLAPPRYKGGHNGAKACLVARGPAE